MNLHIICMHDNRCVGLERILKYSQCNQNAGEVDPAGIASQRGFVAENRSPEALEPAMRTLHHIAPSVGG